MPDLLPEEIEDLTGRALVKHGAADWVAAEVAKAAVMTIAAKDKLLVVIMV